MENNQMIPGAPFSLRPLRNTIVVAIIAMLFFCQRYTAFMLIFALPIFLAWIPCIIYLVARKPDRGMRHVHMLAIWIIAFAVIAVVHTCYAVSARNYANKIVAGVEKYSAEQGHCPASLEQIGSSNIEMKAKLGMADYVCDAGIEPHLFYGVTYIAFDMYYYDFKTRQWEYKPD